MFKTSAPNTAHSRSNHPSLHSKDKGDETFFQAKLNIGQSGDQYEIEADRVADKVIARGNEQSNTFFQPSPVVQKQTGEESLQEKPLHESITPLVQTKPAEEEDQEKCAECEKEETVQKQEENENEIQQKLLESLSPIVQRRTEEEEVQSKDEEVQRQEITPEPQIQRKTDPGLGVPEIQNQEEEVQEKEGVEEESIQEKNIIQKNEEQNANSESETLPLQTKSDGSTNPISSVETKLNSSKGGGTPLDGGTKSEMESGFGTDFSTVRVHDDSTSVQMNQELSSQAFTNGNDIYFNQGKYDPGSSTGKHLLAHELTHTVQQGASTRMKPDIQKSEDEVDHEELLRQIEESNKEQQDAFDPSEANQTRQEAAEEGAQAEQLATAEIAEPESTEPETLPEGGETESSRLAIPIPKAPDTVVPSSQAKEEAVPEAETESSESEDGGQAALAGGENTNGPSVESGNKGGNAEGGETLKYLEQKSAGVCNKGAVKTQKLADNETAHDTAEDKATQTDGSVVPPTEEGQSRSNADQVNTLDGAEVPEANDAEIKLEMDKAISDAVPNKVKELNEFESEKKAQVIGNKVLAGTSKQVGEIQGTYNEIEKAPTPAESDIPKELPEIEQAPETPKMNLGQGAVPAVPTEQTDLSNFEKDADNIYEKEGVSVDMQAEFEKVDSGDIAEANKEKGVLKEKVANEPANLQAFASEKQKKVETDLQNEEDQVKASMKDKRKNELEGAKNKQVKTKTEMEKKREAVTAWINKRYTTAKTNVTEKLSTLESQALAKFDKGQKKHSKQFEKNVKRRVNAWKSDRYSGFWGGAKWVKDKFVGIDHFSKIKEIFTSERATFVAAIDLLIVDINAENEKTITSCKTEVSTAKTEIQEFISKLGPELIDVGKKAQEETTKKLDELDKHIEKEKKKLQQKLCDKKDEAIKAIDKKIEKMKSEMSGLVGKLGALLLYAAKKFFKWAIGKIGGSADKIISLLDKGATVLKQLFTDPIGFFKNLVRAVGGGIKGFVTNIVSWLKKGLVGWLMGQMGDSGLELPKKFDMKGIIFLGLQVAGLTWNVIRPRIVKGLGPKGEQIMSAAEKGVDIIKRVIKEGPIVLWDIILEKAGEIKEKVMEGIRNWAITKIIQKMSVKLLSMLNPAGAIFQAIMLLYDVVMFFVDNWNRIIDFVKSVFDSIGAIASGAIGKASGFIEKTLGSTIPMILSFAARFVGLAGIGKAIRKVIETIQKPFKKILDKMIAFLVKQVKKLFKSGKAKIKGAVAAIFQFWKNKRPFKGADGKNHDLYFKGSGKGAVLTVASTPITLTSFLSNAKTGEDTDKKAAKTQALALSQQIDTLKATPITGSNEAAKSKKSKEVNDAIKTKMDQLAPHMKKLMGGGENTVELLKQYLNKKVTNKDGSVNKNFIKAFDSNKNKIDGKKVYLFSEGNSKISRNKNRAQQGFMSVYISSDENNMGMLLSGGEKPYAHFLFKPENMVLKFQGGKYIASYETEKRSGGGKQKFTVDIEYDKIKANATDQSETRTVVGKNMATKPGGMPRGKTDSAGGEFDNAHLIGDQFGGSGYNQGLNIYPSSETYNRKTMLNKENSLYKQLEPVTPFKMTVSARINHKIGKGKFNGNNIKKLLDSEFSADNGEKKDQIQVKEGMTAKMRAEVAKDLDKKKIPGQFTGVTYSVNQEGKSFPESIGLDTGYDGAIKKRLASV